MRLYGAVRGQDRHLAHLGVRVGRQKRVEGLTGCLSRGKELEPQRAVASFGKRLGCDRTHSRTGPHDRRCGGEGARLNGDPELAGLRISRDDRVGQGCLAARIFALYSRFIAW
jgi:hypothetical protein